MLKKNHMEQIPVFAFNSVYVTESTLSIGPDGLNKDLDDFDFKLSKPLHRMENYKKMLHSFKKLLKQKLKVYAPEEESPFSAKVNELTELISPYTYWELWTSSEYCSFSREEIAVIKMVRKAGNIKYASVPGIDSVKLNEILIKVMRKLKYTNTLSDYNWWIVAQQKLTSRKELFLNAPLNTLKNSIPMRVLSVLCYLGETLNEILSQTSEKELLRTKRMGKKGLLELKDLLGKFDCLDRLRSI
jgi:DNA-directed RNA polymerase alpha subunit